MLGDVSQASSWMRGDGDSDSDSDNNNKHTGEPGRPLPLGVGEVYEEAEIGSAWLELVCRSSTGHWTLDTGPLLS